VPAQKKLYEGKQMISEYSCFFLRATKILRAIRPDWKQRCGQPLWLKIEPRWNFLADLQNESNEEKSTHENSAIPGPTVSSDIQSFINQSNTKSNTKKDGNNTKSVKTSKTEKEIDSGEDISFDDDDCDDAIDLCEDDKDREIKVNIKPGELEELKLSENFAVEKRNSKLTEIYKCTLMDSEGVVRTAERMEEELNGTADEEEVKEIVFPGQVEDSEENSVCKTMTILEFKATYRTETETLGNQHEVKMYLDNN